MPRPVLIIQHVPHECPGLLSGLIEEYSVPSLIVDLSRSEPYPDPRDYSAVITLGGPQSANDLTEVMLDELSTIDIILQENIPYLGICLGMQTLVKAAKGTVTKCSAKETGFFGPDGTPFTVDLTLQGIEDPLFDDLGKRLRIFQLHGETVTLHDGISLLATGNFCKNQIVKVSNRAYGIQSHFELTPQLLLSWLSIDNDLRCMDHAQLMETFHDIHGDYTHTGTTILKNFLHVAEII
jgi:GMP synthase-like glutamine amidotransferase